MGETITLNASDGHTFSAYCADPTEAPARGGLVVIQEIFGVNGHIRRVCDDFAARGFRAVAPALFDRAERGVELDYDQAGTARGREIRGALGWSEPLRDIDAARNLAASAGPVAVVGYCWGGSLAWLAACRLAGFGAAACYYGGQIVQFADENPRCPTLLHFGALDPLISIDAIASIRAAHPDLPILVHPGAGHGFNCEARADHRPEIAAVALDRTLTLFARALGRG
ncbi:dienelactone hydrolase family protein [Roseospira marina]|uniref:Dienelactone hydrolase family protein n=1 Tax=Roseospira marina TaxID=140057 RepID=A0A5M6I7H9_9PROT|nr:dienelactone hydrolase family protein [Roseospira marina]KAA5604072.1 dienelactone hydrolase family protein [Roseospira marina]MBB4315868.1 carboxymethylenebutenolidase [Roseospira marina]MBB5088992.1 carboxymethylenebutenolidase [Roseospira marina]